MSLEGRIVTQRPETEATRGFTLIELIISVALLIVALSIALFAVIGSSGLIAKTDARGLVSEGGRSVGDTIRRTVDNAPIGAVMLIDSNENEINEAIRVKAFSDLKSGITCTTIGRTTVNPVNGEEKYVVDENGDTIALIIHSIDSNTGLCPEITATPIYQNRLTSAQASVVDLHFSLQTIVCQNQDSCRTKQFLRYYFSLEQKTKDSGGTAEARKPSLAFMDGLAIGLVNEATTVLKIETTSLPDANANGTYTAGVAASGGVPNYTWSATSNWPQGSHFAINPSTGVITVTPNSQQDPGNTYTVNVTVTDSDDPINTASRVLTIKVLDNLITITTTQEDMGPATEGSQYNLQFAATIRPSSGSCGSCVWSIESGTLPLSMSFDSIGKLSGKPNDGTATNSPYNLVIKAVESESNPNNYITKAFQLTVLPPGQSIVITTPSLPAGVVGQFYNGSPAGFQLTATGAAGYIWSITSGSLPPSLQLNSSTGYIYGVPACPAGQSPPFTVRATDSGNPTKFGTKEFTINITDQFSSCGMQQG